MRLLAILGILLLIAACNAPATATPPAEADATDATDATDAAGGDATTVTISDFDFGDDITVPAGTTVTFANEDGAAHTVTEGTDGEAAVAAAFDEEVASGASVDVTFDEPGTYDVTCRFHSTMNMTVTVEG